LLEDPGDGAAESASASVRSGFLSSIHCSRIWYAPKKRTPQRTSVCPMLFCKGSRVQQCEWTQVAFVDEVPIGSLRLRPAAKMESMRSWPILVRVHFPQSKRLPLKVPDAHERESKESGRHYPNVNPVVAVTIRNTPYPRLRNTRSMCSSHQMRNGYRPHPGGQIWVKKVARTELVADR